MTVAVEFDITGTDGLETLFRRFPAAASRSMSRAINSTMNRNLLPLAREKMTEQVRFPFGYLDGNRLAVSQIATPTRLEGRVTGRDRPTSLARFAVSSPTNAKIGSGLMVEVKPGVVKGMRSAFFIGLNSGNLGVAIRLRPGEPLLGRSDGVNGLVEMRSRPGTYLLYGPSVDQILVAVYDTIEPEVEAALEKEFYRLLDLELTGQLGDGDE